jgi:hypothetical protein
MTVRRYQKLSQLASYSGVMVHEVRRSPSSLVLTLHCSSAGTIRKALGLTFVGETREADVIVVGDIHITGLDNEVNSFSLYFFTPP